MDKRENEIREGLEEANKAARANNKDRQNNTTRKNNKLWLWLGVLVLVFILLFWLFSIGMFEDLIGTTNG